MARRRKFLPSRRWWPVAVALALLGAGGLTQAGAHGGDAAKVHSCYLTVPNPGNDPPLGSVRIVKATEACKLNETALDWNAQGIKGDTGDTGAQGPQGPAGPQGLAGASGLGSFQQVSTDRDNVVPAGSHFTIISGCGSGFEIVSGAAYTGTLTGGTTFNFNRFITVLGTEYTSTSGFTVYIVNTDTVPRSTRTHISLLCAQIL